MPGQMPGHCRGECLAGMSRRDGTGHTPKCVPVSRSDAPSRPGVLADMKKPARGGLWLLVGWRVGQMNAASRRARARP